MAGLSRVSPVFALKAKPSTAMRLSDTVLNMLEIMRDTNRRCWYSLISTTCSQ